jgi:hypothetical protein
MNSVFFIPLLLSVLNILGLIGNFAWSTYNSRMENAVLKHIDDLKGWVGANHRTIPMCEVLMKEIAERLSRAGA